ncbi:BTB-domain-containing protein [Rhizophagus irregularis]|uniref:BTB-domain-containing protein n=1 Tax=Rhizophagus irregularis TaxID=588596 RepID=A0A2N1N6J4_9GLOM|nr:BTB-domain-containing protein [Rhizophagus irregularis]
MTLVSHSNLSKDFSLIINGADDYDVIIQVGENQNTKEFRAHSVILRARSPYFKAALSANWITRKNNMIMFNKPNITPIVFKMILKYIYTGEIDLAKQSGENILGLLISSDELLLEELFDYVQDYLIEKQTEWIHKNFVFVLNTVLKSPSCEKLRDYCLNSICKHPTQLFSSNSFPSINREILCCLLKSDDLQIEEIIIWDNLVKWGIEQTPGLESDRAEWNNENYKALKKTLNQFIPLIRFVEIFRADFFDKVRPYKAIIPNHIFEEIEEFYYKDTIPIFTISTPRTGLLNRKGNFRSNIIRSNLANIIVNWIDKKNAMSTRTGNDPSYKFNLAYYGSRDGIDNDTLKNKCNGQVASLILIKEYKSTKIFGGYSSIGFNSLGKNYFDENGYRFYNSSDNFIFSFENSEDIQNMKIGRVINKSRAMMEYFCNGFNFGGGSFRMVNNMFLLNNCNRYEKILNDEYVGTIKEVEVFVVTKE